MSYTAKEAFIHISELQNLENKFDGGELQLGEDIMDQFKDGKDKLMEKIESLKLEIGKSIATSTTQVSNKITNIFDPSKIEKGIKDLVPKN